LLLLCSPTPVYLSLSEPLELSHSTRKLIFEGDVWNFSQACWMMTLLTFLCPQVLANIMSESYCCFWKWGRNSRHSYLFNGLCDVCIILVRLLYTYLQLLSWPN
jgi:hypothetical protein